MNHFKVVASVSVCFGSMSAQELGQKRNHRKVTSQQPEKNPALVRSTRLGREGVQDFDRARASQVHCRTQKMRQCVFLSWCFAENVKNNLRVDPVAPIPAALVWKTTISSGAKRIQWYKSTCNWGVAWIRTHDCNEQWPDAKAIFWNFWSVYCLWPIRQCEGLPTIGYFIEPQCSTECLSVRNHIGLTLIFVRIQAEASSFIPFPNHQLSKVW